MDDNFSQRVKDVITFSKEEALRLGHDFIGTEHLVLGILRNDEGKAIDILNYIGIELNELRRKIESLNPVNFDSQSKDSANKKNLHLTRQAERALKTTFLEAKLFQSSIINTAHLLLCILRNENDPTTKVFNKMNINYNHIKDEYKSLIDRDDSSYDIEEGIQEEKQSFETATPSNKKISKKKTKTPVLDNFGKDLTSLAEKDELDPIIGRNNEIQRVSQILSRRKKNNPILIGEPGVGKSAIAEGLAIRIIKKKVSRILFNKRIISLDLASLVAGTKYRGQFEERMRSLMMELENESNNIIFIDELHTLVGAGSASGSLDAANMFKPALARGEIQIIGATTLDEYRKFIEKDGALERRFQKIMISPPTKKDTMKILQGLQKKYEDHHKVTYTSESIKACVDLSERYITDKFLPDKAIDVMDEVGSRVRIHNINVPNSIIKLERQLSSIIRKKEKAIKNQNFEDAALQRDKEKKIVNKINTQQIDWKNNKIANRPYISEDEVSNVISMMTGIPLTKVAESESKKLINMPFSLRQKIIGQDQAIESLSKAILRSRAGFDNPNRPIGSFIFLGPTGIGKTELAKQLAKYLFSDEESLVKIDMSEYMERYNISRLIGAPPGYVGHEEGGQLTEKVRRFPYSVVLFDEIEKAHKDVFNILLQILDEGTVTDSLGRKIDFKNTILILTSNIGTAAVSSSSLGFYKNKLNNKDENNLLIMDEVKRYFNPEFLNRLDEVIIFNTLLINDLYNIVDLLLNDLRQNLKKKNVSLIISKTAKDFIIKNVDHREWGARPIRRVIQNYIENIIAEKFVKEEFTVNGKISIKAKDNKLIFSQFLYKRNKKEKKSAK